MTRLQYAGVLALRSASSELQTALVVAGLGEHDAARWWLRHALSDIQAAWTLILPEGRGE